MGFATAINCMDGRTQLPVIEYLKGRFGVEYVDAVTEPGPNRILAEDTDEAAVASILRRVDISVHKHGSGAVAIVGHHDCAGNPAGKDEQWAQLRSAAALLTGKYPQVEVIALWVDENWQVGEVETGR